MKPKLLIGDAVTVMRRIPTESVDAIVTDPPYGLGFMGKAWDDLPPGEEWARECLRVLKPGGHLLAFGGTRTWHRLAVAVEDAGFEIRDSIAWLYGSGFPKSLDVSKAIDKAGGASPADQARILQAARERSGMTRDQVAQAIGCTVSSVRDWEEGRARSSGRPVESITPSPAYRDKLAVLLGYTTDERRIVGATIDRRGDGSVVGLGHSGVRYGDASTDAARQWRGWGTAMKPAFEPIVVARKPLVGTVAANVQAHGTGALNIDACRIGDELRVNAAAGNKPGGAALNMSERGMPQGVEGREAVGRWPANVALDEDQAKPLNDSSRYFYCAKAPKNERPKVDGVAHPTVKPLSLMRWLVRLVTPTGGLVLDPFAGSGTTAEAAMLEGFRVTLIEREREYVPLIMARIARAQGRDMR